MGPAVAPYHLGCLNFLSRTSFASVVCVGRSVRQDALLLLDCISAASWATKNMKVDQSQIGAARVAQSVYFQLCIDCPNYDYGVRFYIQHASKSSRYMHVRVSFVFRLKDDAASTRTRHLHSLHDAGSMVFFPVICTCGPSQTFVSSL